MTDKEINEALKTEIVEILISEQSTVLNDNGDSTGEVAVFKEGFDGVANKICSLIQAITDPENQPNQYGIILYNTQKSELPEPPINS